MLQITQTVQKVSLIPYLKYDNNPHLKKGVTLFAKRARSTG